MISAINVTTTAAIAIPANVKRVGVLIQNVSDTTIYLKMDESTTALTTANGLALLPSEYLSFATKDHQSFAPIYVIHGGSGNKEIRVQEFEKA